MDERARAVVDAATRLVRREGSLAGVPVDRIAAEAGVAKATLYRRFPSKDALAAELARQGIVEAQPGEDRRSQIIEAAARAFARAGFRGTSMEQVAAEAGISPATIYWYFPSKEMLAAEVLYQVGPTLLAERLGSYHGDEPPAVVLRRFARAMLERGRARGDLLRMMLLEVPFFPELQRVAFERAAGPNLAHLARYMATQTELGRLRPGDPRARVVAFVGPLIALVLFKQAFGDRLPFEGEELVDGLVDTFLTGAGAPDGGGGT
ncbi:MAG TPA: TetR/AcrR family transcriptional regulator [Chloroflexota bacterium]